MSMDGYPKKFVMEENNIGVKGFAQDSMEGGILNRERHNLSMDTYYEISQVSQVQTKSKYK